MRKKTSRTTEDFVKTVLSTRAGLGESPNFSKIRKSRIPSYSFRGSGVKLTSVGSGVGNATKEPDKVYTGSAIIGIAQMAKSNAVPVFNSEHILEIARMRR